ncbi:MAG: exodeoxyribonuclease V subunit gamma, partial [Chitinophagales bacterium]|nr:exodeoxyribonuclease V subunit gamma [Chitinophagales bacterium]
ASDIATISFFASSSRDQLPWLLLLNDKKFLSSLPLNNPEGIVAFRKLMNHWLSEAKNLTLPMLFEKIINESGYLTDVLKSEDKAWNLQVLHTFFDFVKNEAAKNAKITLTSFLNMIEQMHTHRIQLNVMKAIAADDGVLFSTCHSAKGLEFQYVFLIGCTNGGWEKARSGAKNYSLPDTLTFTTEENKIESMRRLFYVGVTRAKEFLSISYASQDNDGKKKKIASQFVSEAGLTPQFISLPEEELIETLGDLMKVSPSPVAAKIEKSLVEKRLQNFALSPSTLSSYLDCPIRFYYENIIRIPAAANDSMAFGSAVHYALEQLFKKMKAGGERFPEQEILVGDFVAYLLRNKLSFTEKQFENRMNLGKQLLPAYYNYYVNKWNKVVVLEYFIKDVEVNGIPLKGKLDKIEFDGSMVNVVDYKTGNLISARQKGKLNAPDEENPLGGDYWRQLVFYRILLDNLKTKNWKMQAGIIDFIEEDAKTKSFHQFPLAVTPDAIAIVKDQIKTAYTGIMNHEFYNGCGKENCSWCKFVSDNYSPELIPALTENEN